MKLKTTSAQGVFFYCWSSILFRHSFCRHYLNLSSIYWFTWLTDAVECIDHVIFLFLLSLH